MKQRNFVLDATRCLCNYLIVILHAGAALQYGIKDSLENVIWHNICWYVCSLALFSFFLISGYLLFKNFSLSTYPRKLLGRVKRLAVPYVMWNVLFVIVYLLGARCVPRLNARVETFGLTTFTGCFSKILSVTVSPIDGPLWFIRMIFILALISPIMWLFLRHLPWAWLSLLLLWCVGESYWGYGCMMSEIMPAYAVVVFSVGGILALRGKDLVFWFKNKWWVAVGIVCVAINISKPYILPAELNWVSELIGLYCDILSAPALIALVANLPVNQIQKSRYYQKLQDASFFVYAGHFLFCGIVLHSLALLYPTQRSGKVSFLVLSFVGFGVPFLLSTYVVAKRFFPRTIKLLDGSW